MTCLYVKFDFSSGKRKKISVCECNFCKIIFDKIFSTRNSHKEKHYCSNKCRNMGKRKYERKIVICLICKNEFLQKHHKHFCCSKKCSNKLNAISSRNKRYVHNDVKITCETCQKQFIVKWAKRTQRFCCHKCAGKSPQQIERFLKSVEGCAQDPIRNAKISKAFLGDNNPSKRPEVKQKIKQTLIEFNKIKNENKPKIIKLTPRYYTLNHKDVKCRWYLYIDKNNKQHYCQGGYELVYAQWLDQHNINFISHPHIILYRTDESEKVKRYHPDFYLIDNDTYIDVKSNFTLVKDIHKFELIRKYNPTLKLEILSEQELKNLGINLSYKSLAPLKAKYLLPLQDKE